MKNHDVLRFALGLLLLSAVTGCFDGDGGGSPAPQTLKQFAVADISTRTTETGLPQEINDLALDTSDEDPAQFDDLLQSP